MKKLVLLGTFILTYLLGNAQIVNHPQSFDGYGWSEKNGSNIILSAGKYSESYIINYDLSNGVYTYLNDSMSLRLSNINMIGNVGVAIAGINNVYYTNNNWQSFAQSTTQLDKIIRTNSGFLGKASTSSSTANYYHSTNGNTWTLVLNALKGDIVEKDGKTWIASRPNNYHVSYDGGLTFTNKTPFGPPSTNLSEFIPFDTLNAIGIAGANLWYYTTDGGDNWTTFPGFSNASFIYASNLDTIYTNFSSTGLNMSIDTGNTWQPASIPLPENIASRMYEVGNYLVSQIGWNGQNATFFSQGIGMPWTQLQKRVVSEDYNDVCFKGNKGLIVGDNGVCSYSHDKGKTYNIVSTTLGTEDLKACEVFNDTLMLVGDRKSNIWVSKDAGLTWNKNYSNSLNYIAKKFRASADLTTIVLFRNGQNVLSTNQGLTWNVLGSLGGTFDGTVTPLGKVLIVSGANILEMNKSNGSTTLIKTFVEPNVQGNVIEMIDDNNGYVIAINTTDTTTVIFRTTDGWTTYTKTGTINSVLTVEPNPLVPSFPYAMNLALHVIAPDTLYINRFNTSNASVSSNVVYKSFNGGVSWITDSIVPYKQGGSIDRLQGMHYFSDETYVSVWEDGRIVQNTGNIIITGIESNEKMLEQHNVNVFPNPTVDIVHLNADLEIQEVYLLDISGKVIVSELVNSKIHQLNMSELTAGLYFLRIKTDKAITTKKIMKQN